MKKGLYIVAVFVSVLLIGLVSAGLLGDIRNALTGHVAQQDTNVSVTVFGADPVTIEVDNSTLTGGVTPIENGITYVNVYAKVCDPNGFNDINVSSVSATYTNNTETRSNSSCVNISNIDSQCLNFSCNVTMYYWDAPGFWNINVTANDYGNQTPQYNDSQTFSYNLLKALVISPNQLNWTGIYPTAVNETADNDPTVVNNTGNYNGTINLTGLDLYGLTITSEKFGVDNFTVEIVNASCGTGDSVFLVNATDSLVTNSVANRGNLSAGSGAGQEELYYCIPQYHT